MNMGLECRYFNFRTPSFDPWPSRVNTIMKTLFFLETIALSTDLTRAKLMSLLGIHSKVDEIMSA